MPLNNPTAAVKVNSGNYTGDNSANRAISHGLGATPRIVCIIEVSSGQFWFRQIQGYNYLFYQVPGVAGRYAVTAMSDTYFYVGNAGDYSKSANENAVSYYWAAYGDP